METRSSPTVDFLARVVSQSAITAKVRTGDVRSMSRYDGEYNPPVTQIEPLPNLTLSPSLWVQHGGHADTNGGPAR